MLLIVILAVLILTAKIAHGKKEKSDFFHQRADQYKTQPGWQEPGLWRPKWIMDREFHDEEGRITHSDRIYLKLKNDRTIKLYNSRNRPKLQWLKKGIADKSKKRNLFETGDEEIPDTEQQVKVYQEEQDALYNTDGTWWWADESPAKTGKVKIETREIKVGTMKPNIQEDGEDPDDRMLHESRCEWGQLDGYAAKFRKGKILKYKGGTGNISLGTVKVGSWNMRANVHRPLVSKEFSAFQ